MLRSGVLLLVCIMLASSVTGAEEITLVKRARRAAPVEFTRYTVQRGDTLWKILSETQHARYNDFPYLYKKFRELNPEITNLDHIMAGQRIRIPNIPGSSDQFSIQATAEDVYVIKKGQHLAMILRQVYGLPDDLIFNEYLNLIKELNPEIKNLDRVEAGQKVRMPEIRQVVNAAREAAQDRQTEEKAASTRDRKPDQLLHELIEQKVHELTLQQEAAEREENPQSGVEDETPEDQTATASILESMRKRRQASAPVEEEKEILPPATKEGVPPVTPGATEQTAPRAKIEVIEEDRPQAAERPKPEPKQKPKPQPKTKSEQKPEAKQAQRPEPEPSPHRVSAPATEQAVPETGNGPGKKPGAPAVSSAAGPNGKGGDSAPTGASGVRGGASSDKEPKQSVISRIVKNTLLPALTKMGGRQKDKGTYFMPMAGGSSVSIDTSEIPVIELDTGMRVILDMNSKISPEVKGILEQAFPTCRIISGPHEGLESLMDRVLNVSGYFSVNKDAGPLLVGEDEKIRFSGKWIVYKDFSRQNVFVINLLGDGEQQTPDPIRDYASRFGIDLIEMGGRQWTPPDVSADALIDLGRSYRKLFDLLGLPYEQDKELELVSLEALRIAYKAPLLYNGKIILTKEMPDKTMSELLAKKGYRVIDTSAAVLQGVLETLGVKGEGPPVKTVVAASRTELELPAVKVGEVIVLLSPLDTDIARYLAVTGRKIAVW